MPRNSRETYPSPDHQLREIATILALMLICSTRPYVKRCRLCVKKCKVAPLRTFSRRVVPASDPDISVVQAGARTRHRYDAGRPDALRVTLWRLESSSV